MTVQVLKNYLSGSTSAKTLCKDLADTASHLRDTSYYKIVDIDSLDKFRVTTEHLIKICRDVISYEIKIEDLEIIAFALESSDYFTWDINTKDGEKVESAVSNWFSREIPITMDYIKYSAFFLETGQHR